MNTKNNKKYIINISIILLLGGLSIYFTMGDDLTSAITAILGTNVYWISFCFILMILYYTLDGAILYLFARLYNTAYTFTNGMKNAMTGIFWCGITPFASGGQFAQAYVFHRQGITAKHSASILLMGFIVYQSVLVLYTSVVMLFRFQYYNGLYSEFFSLTILGFIVNLAVILSLFLGAKSKHVQHFFCNTILKILHKIRIVKEYEKTKEKAMQSLLDFRTELAHLQKNRKILLITSFLNICKLTIIYSIPFFVAKALHVDVTIYQLLDFIGVCSFIYLITAFIPIPGASGGSEGIYFLLFNPILGAYTATTLLLWRFMTYYLGLILGGIIFITDKQINIKRR